VEDVLVGDVICFRDHTTLYTGCVIKIDKGNIHVNWFHREGIYHYRGLNDLMPEVNVLSQALRDI
jgi:hypothetical protein